MKVVCAWCNKDLTQKQKNASDPVISHGICSQCNVKLTSYAPRQLQKLLNYIREPIFMIDSNGVVKGANRRALKALGKEEEQVVNKLGGDAFECSYANIEGGCGKTIHCKTCAIRNTVMDTLSTGKSYKYVPAFQSIIIDDDEKLLKFIISTEKIGEGVLLRIDQVS